MIRRQFMSCAIVAITSLFFEGRPSSKKNFGGFIKRHQNDFVPALLNPNESVLPRRCVESLNIALMKINNKGKNT